jgi:monovalent cation/proton antiporter MnhG/PhaG subunit
MSVRTILVDVLLALGVGVELIACLGVVAMRDVYDRLHFLAPSALGGILIAAAVLVREGPSMIGLKGLLLAAFLLATSPILAHVTSRAARINQNGDWMPQRGERIEAEGP